MKYSEDEQNLIVLSAITEMTYNERYSALSALMSSTPDFTACEKLLIKRCGIGVYNKVRDKFFDPAFRNKVFAELEDRGVECVTYYSADYPELLKHVPTPPITLFIKGKRQLLKTQCFSIVGARRAMPNTLLQCKRFAKEISEYFTVVSGSAQGADISALEGTGGKAISVIAFGLDHLDVKSGKPLQDVAKNGLFLSEYYPTTVPKTFLFRERNRIIAGLSVGTLITAAAKKSGALITASFAADFGREVFAFPYNIGVASGEGCNNLIKQGASLCQNPLDIVSAFGLDLKPSRAVALSEEESKAYALIKEHGEVFLPNLSSSMGLPAFKLLPVLSALEIKGLVCRLGGNRYSII